VLGVPGELVAPVAEQGGDVELPLAHERLRVDHEPLFPVGAKHVSPVEVLVRDHRLSLVRACVPEEVECRVEEVSLEGPAQSFPTGEQLVGPPGGLVGEKPEGVTFGRGTPESAQQPGGDSIGPLLVHLPERRAGQAPFDEKRSSLVVTGEEEDCATAVPVAQRIGLVLALRLWEVDLEDCRRAVRALHRHDERDVRGLEGRIELQRPRVRELPHESRQPLEPLCAARLTPPPSEPAGDGERAARYSATADRNACSLSWPKTANTTRCRFSGSKARASVTMSSAQRSIGKPPTPVPKAGMASE